jgi:hypothetical protein
VQSQGYEEISERMGCQEQQVVAVVAGSCRDIIECCVGNGFGFNHKIMINIQESSPSIMVTRKLWSAII